MAHALIVVDVQNDFCEGGSMGVKGGAEVAFEIGKLLHEWTEADEQDRAYAFAVATRDHHIDPGAHFSATPDFASSWPPHCVAGTDGAGFHPNLDPQPFDAVFSKGEHSAAYSGFEGSSYEGKPLADWLQEHAVDRVDIAGIATDHCVRATALDAVREGLSVRVLLHLTAGVAQQTTERALTELREAGCELAGSPIVRS